MVEEEEGREEGPPEISAGPKPSINTNHKRKNGGNRQAFSKIPTPFLCPHSFQRLFFG